MNNNENEKESLMYLLELLYNVLTKRFKLFIVVTLCVSGYGLVKLEDYRNFNKQYEAEIILSTHLIRNNVFHNTISKLFIPNKNYSPQNWDKAIFSDSAFLDLKSLTHVSNKTVGDTSKAVINIKYENKLALNDISEGLVKLIENQDRIDEKSKEIRRKEQEYLLNIKQYIAKHEKFNNLLMLALSNRHIEHMGSYSNKEILALIREKDKLELNEDRKIITYVVSKLVEINNFRHYLKNIFLYIVLGSIFGVIMATLLEVLEHLQIRNNNTNLMMENESK